MEASSSILFYMSYMLTVDTISRINVVFFQFFSAKEEADKLDECRKFVSEWCNEFSKQIEDIYNGHLNQRERLILDSKGHSAIDNHKITGDKQWIQLKNRVTPTPSELKTQSTLTFATDISKQNKQKCGSTVTMQPIDDDEPPKMNRSVTIHPIADNEPPKVDRSVGDLESNSQPIVLTKIMAFDDENC